LTVDELAAKKGAAPGLLGMPTVDYNPYNIPFTIWIGHILRYLSSMGTIKETAKDTITANNITQALAMPAIQSVFTISMSLVIPDTSPTTTSTTSHPHLTLIFSSLIID
jgi:hypothetical protein